METSSEIQKKYEDMKSLLGGGYFLPQYKKLRKGKGIVESVNKKFRRK